MGFKLTFERKECIRVSDGQREGVPEGALRGTGDGGEKVDSDAFI